MTKIRSWELQKRLEKDCGESLITYVYRMPTPGWIQFEWDIGAFRPSLDINLKAHTGYWHTLNLNTGEADDRDLKLDNTEDWKWIVRRLNDMQRSVTGATNG